MQCLFVFRKREIKIKVSYCFQYGNQRGNTHNIIMQISMCQFSVLVPEENLKSYDYSPYYFYITLSWKVNFFLENSEYNFCYVIIMEEAGEDWGS